MFITEDNFQYGFTEVDLYIISFFFFFPASREYGIAWIIECLNFFINVPFISTSFSPSMILRECCANNKIL